MDEQIDTVHLFLLFTCSDSDLWEANQKERYRMTERKLEREQKRKKSGKERYEKKKKKHILLNMDEENLLHHLAIAHYHHQII